MIVSELWLWCMLCLEGEVFFLGMVILVFCLFKRLGF